MWMPQELSALQQLARQITAKLQPRPTRRWRVAPRGQRLDLRQTLRRSVAWGGELMQPAWKVKRVEPPRLFILADVSRSMESHAALFLRVARAFALEADARVFVFHTRLAEVTSYMQRDTPAIQEKVNAVTAGFGGGTRIAASLQDFARQHARAQLNRGSRVWVFSDGFDTDEPELLALLCKKCAHAVPASPGFTPRARCLPPRLCSRLAAASSALCPWPAWPISPPQGMCCTEL
jgi:uncharacterized protein